LEDNEIVNNEDVTCTVAKWLKKNKSSVLQNAKEI